jgi:predicted GIY-YIG superfamily endonuclease
VEIRMKLGRPATASPKRRLTQRPSQHPDLARKGCFVPGVTGQRPSVISGAAWWSSTEYFIWMLMRRRKPRPRPHGDRWFVYLLGCADGTLYTGIAKDVGRRCQQHNAGTASRYTRSRLPVEVVHQEVHASRGSALRREAAIKALSRRQKKALIRLLG